MKAQTIDTPPELRLQDIPEPPAGSVFKLEKLEKVSMPHPYCIGTRHVAAAADHFGGMLGAEAIRFAERNGASCDICRASGRGVLSYDQHENPLTLFVSLPNNKADLNKVPGLHAYLLKLKELNLGIEGFAFPNQ